MQVQKIEVNNLQATGWNKEHLHQNFERQWIIMARATGEVSKEAKTFPTGEIDDGTGTKIYRMGNSLWRADKPTNVWVGKRSMMQCNYTRIYTDYEKS